MPCEIKPKSKIAVKNFGIYNFLIKSEVKILASNNKILFYVVIFDAPYDLNAYFIKQIQRYSH